VQLGAITLSEYVMTTMRARQTRVTLKQDVHTRQLYAMTIIIAISIIVMKKRDVIQLLLTVIITMHALMTSVTLLLAATIPV
jgi:hypothetical protein